MYGSRSNGAYERGRAMKTSEVLQAAKAKVESGWTQGTAARNAAGITCNAYDDDARSWCALGAIAAVTPPACLANNQTDEIFQLRYQVQDDLVRPLNLPSSLCFPAWNDAPGRKQEEVVALFDKAIALALIREAEPITPTEEPTTVAIEEPAEVAAETPAETPAEVAETVEEV